MRAYVFVDAENHYQRSMAAAEAVVGSPQAARAMARAKLGIPGIPGFPDDIKGERFGWEPALMLFWDCQVLSLGGIAAPLGARVARAIYVCACAGDDPCVHNMRVRLRAYGFEPVVVKERKDLQRQRQTKLRDQRIIEKPKGCDIAIATRMVADAAADLYDSCCLFTSDADYLPAVETIRRMGKVVWVFGYGQDLPGDSAYRYVPDKFIDLYEVLKEVWHNHHREIKEALQSIGETGPFKDPV